MKACGLLRIVLCGVAVAWAAPLTAQTTPLQTIPPHARGKALYERHCAFCHGLDGRADTPVAHLLKPRPLNFADAVDMARVTDDQMYRAIKEGRPGTAMAAWGGVLSELEIGDLMDYVHSFAPARGARLSGEALSLAVGRRIYEKNCAVCHGLRGNADTEAAKVLHPRPRNFADSIEAARMDDGRMYSAIKLGRPGTAMGGWGGLLSPAEIIDVMRYVRTLEPPPPAGMPRAGLDMLVGERIYRDYCLACHGEKGDGQTTLGRSLVPPARDFTKARLSEKEIAHVIGHGRPGTAMAPWNGVLTPEDIRRVSLYIRRTLERQR